MPSITSWTKLEPRARRTDPAQGLEARLRDPLWLLSRQWQVGEFTAEDAGSPLQARARVEQAPLTRFNPGALGGETAGAEYDPAGLPLEVLVEREQAGDDLRSARDAGLRFLRLLERAGVGHLRGAFVEAYPLARSSEPLGRQAERMLRIAATRVPHGLALAAACRAASGALPASPTVTDTDSAAVLAAITEWLESLPAETAVNPDPAPCWNPERMEYSFAVSAPGPAGATEIVLRADEYASGHLDWHAFDLVPGAALGASADADRRRTVDRTAIPSPVSYRGMPVARWWEFEDGQVNFGAVDAGPADLLRLLLLGFALDYGNDWFIVPVELPTGAVHRVTSLVITDSFGVRTLVRPYASAASPESRWRAFGLSRAGDEAGAEANLLFLPPTLPQTLHGEPIEEVLLLRDEVANLGWAVERRIADAGGHPLDRFEQYQRRRVGEAAPPPPDDPSDVTEADTPTGPRYRLANEVPDYWFPLVPMRDDPASAGIRLVRGRMLNANSEDGDDYRPRGVILEAGRPLRLFEEEVSRVGARVTRAYQYVRWTDGGTHLWIGRRKGPGRGEGSSGLRFDSLLGV